MKWIALNLCLAATFIMLGCGGEEQAQSTNTYRGESVAHWSRALADRDPDYRYLATQALFALADEADSAIQPLIVALDDEDPAVRAGAAQVLGEIGTPASAAESKLVALHKDKDAVVRVSAILALGQVTGSPSAERMIAALQDENQSVRDQAASLIVRMGQPAIPALSKLINEPDAASSRRAIDILGRIGHEDGLPLLMDALGHQDREIRDAAILALGDFGPLSIPHLAKLRTDPNWQKRWAGVYALMLIASPEAAEPMVAALVDDDDRVRYQAIEGLTRLRDDALPALKRALEHEDAKVRLAVVTALSGMGTSDTIPILQEAVGDKDPQVRDLAVLALGATGSPDAIPALALALKSDDAKVRGDATSSLVRFGAAAVPVFETTLKHKNWQVRRASANGLGMIGSREAVPALNKFLYDKDARVRAAAAKAIGLVGPDAATSVSPLIWALDDEQEDVRDNAAYALSRIATGVDTVIPALIKALSEGEPRVRTSAAQAIARIGSDASAAAYPLITAMRDKDATVAQAARLALIKVAGEAVPALTRSLEDDEDPLRVQYIQILGQIGPSASKAVPALMKLLPSNDPAVYDATVFALGLIGPEAKVALVKASRGDDKALAAIANRALQTILKQE